MLTLRRLYKEMQPSDRKILIGSALLMLLFGYLLIDDRIFYIGTTSDAPVIGQISAVSHDVRHKQGNQLVWNHAREEQNIHIGDALFTGRDSSIDMKVQGSTVRMGESSLVNFKRIKGIEVSNLSFGDFKIKVNGTLQLAINGELMELKGRGTELRASIDENHKLTLKATKGETKVTSVQLGNLKINDREPVKEETVASVFPPAPLKNQADPLYYWKIDDIYARNNDKFRLRRELPRWYDVVHNLEWKDPHSGKYTVQMASDIEFSKDIQLIDTPDKFHSLTRLKIGDVFWKVSRDGEQWSRTAHFNFQPRFLAAAPVLTSGHENLQLTAQGAEYKLHWMALPGIEQYFIEASQDKKFPPETTAIARTDQLSYNIHFSKPGIYHFRVRGIDSKTQLTEASGVSVAVDKPALLGPPILPQHEMTFLDPSKPILLPWRAPIGAIESEIKITSLRTSQAFTKRTKESKVELPELPNGPYTYQVTALDELGRYGSPSIEKAFSVKRSSPVHRDLAQSLSTQMEQQNYSYLNFKYPDSRVQVEGAGFTMYSTSQVQTGQKTPLAATMGLRVLNWIKDMGLEGFLKTKIFNYNSAGSEVTPLTAEVRAHKRWRIPLYWDYLREIQVSLFLGGEYYSNNGSPLYAKQYSLVKAGTLIAFPLFHRWDTGGELVYGRGLDSSVKYEIAGYVNYFIKKQWTYGIGYRIHLLEAGKTANPTNAQFREGYLELYSALRYLY